MLKTEELHKIHLKTILELKKNGKFEYFYNFDNLTIQKLFKKFLFQVEKEQII